MKTWSGPPCGRNTVGCTGRQHMAWNPIYTCAVLKQGRMEWSIGERLPLLCQVWGMYVDCALRSKITGDVQQTHIISDVQHTHTIVQWLTTHSQCLSVEGVLRVLRTRNTCIDLCHLRTVYGWTRTQNIFSSCPIENGRHIYRLSQIGESCVEGCPDSFTNVRRNASLPSSPPPGFLRSYWALKPYPSQSIKPFRLCHFSPKGMRVTYSILHCSIGSEGNKPSHTHVVQLTVGTYSDGNLFVV